MAFEWDVKRMLLGYVKIVHRKLDIPTNANFIIKLIAAKDNADTKQ